MDISGIANLATQLSQERVQQAAGIAVLKKALDAESSTAAALLDALPPAPAPVSNLPPHLGQNINTTA